MGPTNIVSLLTALGTWLLIRVINHATHLAMPREEHLEQLPQQGGVTWGKRRCHADHHHHLRSFLHEARSATATADVDVGDVVELFIGEIVNVLVDDLQGLIGEDVGGNPSFELPLQRVDLLCYSEWRDK